MPSGIRISEAVSGGEAAVEKLKGAKDWGPDDLKDLYIGKNHPVGPPETYAAMRVGARFIVLFATQQNKRGPLDAVYYGVWPLNDANLAQVKFGVSRDYLDVYGDAGATRRLFELIRIVYVKKRFCGAFEIPLRRLGFNLGKAHRHECLCCEGFGVVVITITLTRISTEPRIVRRPSASPAKKYPRRTATTGFT